jgi:Amidase
VFDTLKNYLCGLSKFPGIPEVGSACPLDVLSQGKYRGPLHGIPFSIKDIIYAKGIRCTAGSRILSEYVPKADATCIKKRNREQYESVPTI